MQSSLLLPADMQLHVDVVSRDWLEDWSRGPGYPRWSPVSIEFNRKVFMVVTNRAAILYLRTALRGPALPAAADSIVREHMLQLVSNPRELTKRVNLQLLRAWVGGYQPKWIEHTACAAHGCADEHCHDGLVENARSRVRPARFFGSVDVDLNLLSFALRGLPGDDVCIGHFTHGGNPMFVVDCGSSWRVVMAALKPGTVQDISLIQEWQ